MTDETFLNLARIYSLINRIDWFALSSLFSGYYKDILSSNEIFQVLTKALSLRSNAFLPTPKKKNSPFLLTVGRDQIAFYSNPPPPPHTIRHKRVAEIDAQVSKTFTF